MYISFSEYNKNHEIHTDHYQILLNYRLLMELHFGAMVYTALQPEKKTILIHCTNVLHWSAYNSSIPVKVKQFRSIFYHAICTKLAYKQCIVARTSSVEMNNLLTGQKYPLSLLFLE